DQVCGRLDDLPAHERCDLVDDPERTMLGLPQEAWLQEGFVDDGRWDLIAQQTVMADMSVTVGGVTGVNNDQWDGYAAARERLVTAAQTNPRSVVLSGDIHAAMVTTVRADTVGEGTVRDGSSENSGGSIAEFVAPSATTRMNSSLAVGLQLALLSRPDIHAFAPSVHGYVLIDLASERLGATYRNLDPLDPASQPATASQWSLTPDSRIPLGL
ncbi:MAG: alkaline phosphatase D family protein, partial [Actinomycetota bacterium]|nr:alkaline phosphatase D family protein [Actinomycetota bacterium]